MLLPDNDQCFFWYGCNTLPYLLINIQVLQHNIFIGNVHYAIYSQMKHDAGCMYVCHLLTKKHIVWDEVIKRRHISSCTYFFIMQFFFSFSLLHQCTGGSSPSRQIQLWVCFAIFRHINRCPLHCYINDTPDPLLPSLQDLSSAQSLSSNTL